MTRFRLWTFPTAPGAEPAGSSVVIGAAAEVRASRWTALAAPTSRASPVMISNQPKAVGD
jgi:hypothetical protein